VGLAASLVTTQAVAGVHRVADLRTLPVEEAVSWGPAGLAELGGRALLFPWLRGVGAEPWTSDGTANGTSLIADLEPGSGGYADLLGVVGGRAVFLAWSPFFGRDLWVTDGTAEGTAPLFELEPTRDDVWVESLGSLPGMLLLRVNGNQLWRTDGTGPGTTFVARVWDDGCLSRPNESVALSGKLYFCGRDENGAELWVTDGSLEGTRLVRDLRPGLPSSSPMAFTFADDRFYFAAYRMTAYSRYIDEVWVSDGTAQGTRPVFGWPLPNVSTELESRILGRVNGRLIFERFDSVATPTWRYNLWVVDETAHFPYPLRPDSEGALRSSSTALTIGSRAVFGHRPDVSGREPWVTDGTAAGTMLLRQLDPDEGDSFSGTFIAGHDGAAYFCDYADGVLWRTDGTPDGTLPVTSVAPCEWLSESVSLEGVTLFDVCWRESCGPVGGNCKRCRLWRTDGTEPGTLPLLPAPARSGSNPESLTPITGGLAFWVPFDDSGGFGVYRTNGTPVGTVRYRTATGAAIRSNGSMTSLPGGELLVGGWSNESNEGLSLFRSNVGALEPLLSPGSEEPSHLIRVGDRAFFSWNDGVVGRELWRSDGTPGGTARVFDINPGPASSTYSSPVAALGRLWFSAWANRELGGGLWESDGSPEGTILHPVVAEPEWNPDWSLPQIRELSSEAGTLAYLSWNRLYEFDATTAATRLLWEFAPRVGSAFGRTFAGFQGDAVLIDLEPDGRCGLWRTDGTAPGTVRLATTRPLWTGSGWGEPCAEDLFVSGETIYFGACDLEHGCELWASDGTADGGQLFADVAPGPESLAPTGLTEIDGRLYFSGCTRATGCEPWTSDFTPEGTHPLGDVAPGVGSSDPAHFVRSGPWIYFTADDGTGRELWAHSLALFADGFETGDTTRWSGAVPATSRSVTAEASR
jgi:ELWxxDGT repeat protein